MLMVEKHIAIHGTRIFALYNQMVIIQIIIWLNVAKLQRTI